MKRNWAIGFGVLALLLIGWWWSSRPATDATEISGVKRSHVSKRSVRDARKHKEKVRMPRKKKTSIPRVKSEREEPVIDAWVEELPEQFRKLGQGVVDAIDNENLKTLKGFLKDVCKCPNADIRERYVEGLNWFGKEALVEMTCFLGDPNEEVAQTAFNAWDSAVDEVEDEHFRIDATVAAMQTLKNTDSLASVASKLEAAEDRRAAVEAIIKVMEGDNVAAQKAAKDAYEFITGDEWRGAAGARVKALVIGQEDAAQ